MAREDEIKGCETELEEVIRDRIQPTALTINHHIAMIAIVGRELSTSPAIAVKVLGALANHKINIRLIDHGAARISMLLGVDGDDYIRAIQAIYTVFARV